MEKVTIKNSPYAWTACPSAWAPWPSPTAPPTEERSTTGRRRRRIRPAARQPTRLSQGGSTWTRFYRGGPTPTRLCQIPCRRLAFPTRWSRKSGQTWMKKRENRPLHSKWDARGQTTRMRFYLNIFTTQGHWEESSFFLVWWPWDCWVQSSCSKWSGIPHLGNARHTIPAIPLYNAPTPSLVTISPASLQARMPFRLLVCMRTCVENIWYTELKCLPHCILLQLLNSIHT